MNFFKVFIILNFGTADFFYTDKLFILEDCLCYILGIFILKSESV